VFISHAGEDKHFARELRRDLHTLGISAFLDQDELQAGDNATDMMINTANSAPVGVAVFSSHYFRKVGSPRRIEQMSSDGRLHAVLSLLCLSQGENCMSGDPMQTAV
jgi:hypothetical protein